jgi:cell division protein FtsB
MEAVEAEIGYLDIISKTKKASTEMSGIEAKISKLEAEYAHLKTAVNIVQTLIGEYKYGLDAMTTIFLVAQKYGEPITVLKAIETYGQIIALHQEKTNLEGKVTQLNDEIAKIEGEHSEALNHLAFLNSLVLKVGTDVGIVQGKFEASAEFNKLLNFINNPGAAGYGTHVHTALLASLALLGWVDIHQGKFKSASPIRGGLEALVNELGGLKWTP